MRLPIPIVAVLIVLLADVSTSAAGSLTVTTRDAAGQPLTCRVVARDTTGTALFPDTTEICYPHHGAIPYFISDGSFTLGAEGPVTITTSRGPEYHSDVRTIQVTGNASVAVTLHRIADMASAGWYCGDTHAHLWHNEPDPLEPVDGVRLARAEGLNFISVLDADRYFIGAPDPASTSDCLLYASLEYRSHVFGHITMPGLQSLISPYSSAAPGDPPFPVNADMVQLAKTHQGVSLYAHPVSHFNFWDTSDWPMTGIARELPADAALGLVDGIEVFSYSNYTPLAALSLWYDLLDTGVRLPATAGTDVVLNRPASNPVGGYRIYVHTGQSTFDMNAWLEALRQGRSFITAGPLITDLHVGGATIGDTLHLCAGATSVQGSVSFVSDLPLQQLEVVWNGSVAYSAILPFAYETTADFTIPIDGSGWLAVRATSMGRNGVHVMNPPMVHSNPIMIDVPGAPSRARARAVKRLIEWNEELIALVRQRGGFDEASDSLHVESVLASGTAALASPFASPPSPPELVKPLEGEAVRQLRPSLAWRPPADPDPGDLFEYRVRFADSEEMLQSANPFATSDSSFSTRDALEHGHVYWWSVEALDVAGNSATSPASWFSVDTTGTAGVPEPVPPARWSAGPVPFAASVEIASSVPGAARVEIFDVRGRRIRILDGETPLVWNGRDSTGREVPSGLYFALPRIGPALRLVKLR